jgi:hypothetical protein
MPSCPVDYPPKKTKAPEEYVIMFKNKKLALLFSRVIKIYIKRKKKVSVQEQYYISSYCRSSQVLVKIPIDWS